MPSLSALMEETFGLLDGSSTTESASESKALTTKTGKKLKSSSSIANVLSTELESGLRKKAPLINVNEKLKLVTTDIDVAEKKETPIVKEMTKKGDSAGPGWFGLPATEISDKIKVELQAIKMRGFIDPKRFYRSNDSHKMPKFFSIGTVVSGEGDRFNTDPTTRPSVKGGLVDELLADDKSKSYLKRKFKEVQTKKMSGGRLHLKKKQNAKTPAWRKFATK
eukprot:CFRG1602T1